MGILCVLQNLRTILFTLKDSSPTLLSFFTDGKSLAEAVFVPYNAVPAISVFLLFFNFFPDDFEFTNPVDSYLE